MKKARDWKFDIQFFGGDGDGDGSKDQFTPLKGPEGHPGPEGPPGDPKPAEKTFTQTDVDKIVKDRLEKDRKKYEGFDELKEKAQKFDELENKRLEEAGKLQELYEKKEAALMGEMAKLQAVIDTVEAERKSREIHEWKKTALAKAMKITPDKVSDEMIAFIQGEDEEAIGKSAVAFVKVAQPKITSTDGGGNPPSGTNPTVDKNEAAVARVLKDAEYQAKMLQKQHEFFGKK